MNQKKRVKTVKKLKEKGKTGEKGFRTKIQLRDELLEEVLSNSYPKIAKKYGVCLETVKHWLQHYQIRRIDLEMRKEKTNAY